MKTILTQNLRKATKLTMQTIQKNEMGVISGASGMGKSTFRQMLVNKLRADKYNVAYYVPFRSNRTQTNRILESIYEVAFPEQRIPVNENRKIRHLKTLGNSKIVLVIDNMQNLDIQTIREIKIIWEELSIPIIFFLKSDTKILELLEDVEIGQRVNHYSMKELKDEEVLQIAKTQNISFEDALTKKRFLGIAGGNPLTVKHLAKLIKQTNSNGLVTLKNLMQIEVSYINLIRKQHKISVRDIVKEFQEEGKNVSVGFGNEVLTGKRTDLNSGASKGGVTPQEFLEKVKQMVKERTK